MSDIWDDLKQAAEKVLRESNTAAFQRGVERGRMERATDAGEQIRELISKLATETKRREEAGKDAEQYRKNWLSLQNAIGEECQLRALDRVKEWREQSALDTICVPAVQSAILREAVKDIQGVTDSIVWCDAELRGRQDVIEHLLEMADAIDAARGAK